MVATIGGAAVMHHNQRQWSQVRPCGQLKLDERENRGSENKMIERELRE